MKLSLSNSFQLSGLCSVVRKTMKDQWSHFNAFFAFNGHYQDIKNKIKRTSQPKKKISCICITSAKTGSITELIRLYFS